MPRVDLKLHVDIDRSPRVVQLEGMFDVPRSDRSVAEYHFDVPLEDRDWQVGLITGPSGAGKSSVARALFGDALVERYDWVPGRAIVDCFGDLGIREVSSALSSVGFSSPPGWLKPYSVLSNGEKFRADLARALVDTRDVVVFDEFTSLVDRTVGRIGAHAVAKAVRAKPGKRFVAVTCHDDVIDWLQPDWVLEPHAGAFAWRSLQRRPQANLEVFRADYSAWQWFHHHHYLTASLHKGSRCFVGLVDGRLACFAGCLHFPNPKRRDLVSLSRLVVLPDFQGLGLGSGSFAEAMAKICLANGKTMIVGTSHPALIHAWAKSAKWNMTNGPKSRMGKAKYRSRAESILACKHAIYRRVASFMWRGGAFKDDALDQAARAMWN